MSTLRITEADDRVHVQLDRPEVGNAIDDAMVEELHALCADVELRPRIVILSGSSEPDRGIFAAGADIARLLERGRDDALRGINSRLFIRIAALPMPVIAALDGHALGGGAELALAADFRIATPRTRIGSPETGLGILAAAGATWRLVELVGEAVAKEMLLAGRTLTAEEALGLRLVTEIHEPADLLAASDALADRIARQDPLAVVLTKKVLQAPRAAHPLIDEIAQSVLFESDAKTRRMRAFLDRKKDAR